MYPFLKVTVGECGAFRVRVLERPAKFGTASIIQLFANSFDNEFAAVVVPTVDFAYEIVR